jgi:pimeloyl-ACP methyl ester carboxylesterase
MSSLKKPQHMLALALVLCILGSFFAGLFNTSFYSVKVKKITFNADHGTLSGLLYMPKGAGKDDQRPVIITTHGYLNSKEMQDAPAIEMSRRGYIVLALDMYDHGDSRWSEPIEVGKQFSTFWIYSQFDAAKYIYGQDFVKKDNKGNAYIAVSGHSMGGFSTLLALYMDEMNSLKAGYRMIHAGISVGADFSYAATIAKQDQLQAAYGSRTVGMIAAHFDEFFFNKTDEEKTAAEKAVVGTVTYKDFAARTSGKAFLGLKPTDAAGEAGKFYTAASGAVAVDGKEVRASQQGKRIIYTPYETHPWNHFSKETTSNLIDFYTTAFSGVTSPNQTNANLSSGRQIWWLKEGFSFVALIGFFMMFIPLITLLLQLPVLKRAKTAMPAVISEPKTTAQKAVFWVAIVISTLIPAYFYPALINKKGEGINILALSANVILLGAAVVVITFWCAFFSNTSNRAEFKAKAVKATISSAIIAAATIILKVMLKKSDKIITLGKTFNEPITNQIAYWAVMSGIIAAIVTLCFYYLNKKAAGTKFEDYGISFNIPSILSNLLVALIAVVLGYALLWITQAIFTTDYRIWTLAVRTFTAEHLITALRYIPIFFIYYFINSVVINANTRFSSLKGAKGYIVAILLNVGGLVLWLLYQYGSLLFKHTGAYPAEALNGIVMIALVPCLAVAAVYAKKLFNKTGSVWLAAFLNSILFTMITVANTVMFWNLM